MGAHLNDKHLTVAIGEAEGWTTIRANKPITAGRDMRSS
jgi:hypothetical protein